MNHSIYLFIFFLVNSQCPFLVSRNSSCKFSHPFLIAVFACVSIIFESCYNAVNICNPEFLFGFSINVDYYYYYY